MLSYKGINKELISFTHIYPMKIKFVTWNIDSKQGSVFTFYKCFDLYKSLHVLSNILGGLWYLGEVNKKNFGMKTATHYSAFLWFSPFFCKL